MAERNVGTIDDYRAARARLLEREKELTRMGDELAGLRRELPWVPVGKRYTFQTARGPNSLADLFDGRSQLVVYHFMFGPDWEAGCPVCSSIADSFNGVLAHLAARGVTMICSSRAPIEKLLGFRDRMGWTFDWASSHGSEFNWDFRLANTREEVSSWVDQVPTPIAQQFSSASGADILDYFTERPGLSVFAREDEEVYLTYETTARGLEVVMQYYGILDRVPRGRDEHEPTYQAWVRHHDRYAETAGPAPGA